MSKVPVSPFGARVVAVREQAATKTAAGLYLPEGAKEKSEIAKVVAIGKDVKEIRENDRVVIGGYSTTTLKIDGVEYLVAEEKDVVAKVA
jgi:chaperonin GroES